mgnify:CR=1 FL=1
MRPRIGMTVTQYPEYDGFKLRRDYVRAIEMAGGLPLLLPVCGEDLIEDCLDSIDGLLLTGGDDFLPELFGELPVECEFEPERDHFEMALIRAAWQRQMPILAICRGIQGLNIALDGSIYQDLAYAGLDRIEHRQREDMKLGSHPIHISDERLAALLGADIVVNSSHHQAIKRLSPEFATAAVAPDGIIEAIVAKDKARYAVGVQWHPETLLPVSALFSDFVAAVAQAIATPEEVAEEEEADADE